jgi:nitrite reductase (NO-forming)/hydroxylamine reductase
VISLISIASDDPGQVQGATTGRSCRKLKMPGAGNLFVKTHPKSKNFWADAPMNPERELAEVRVTCSTSPTWQPEGAGRVSTSPRLGPARQEQGHPARRAGEYNEKGDEVWFSVWTGNKTDQSAIVIYDDKTLKVKKVIKDPASRHADRQVQRVQHDARRLLIVETAV